MVVVTCAAGVETVKTVYQYYREQLQYLILKQMSIQSLVKGTEPYNFFPHYSI